MKVEVTKSLNLIDWLNKKGHFQGMAWTMLASIFCTMTDTTIRLVSVNLHAMQITFFRLATGFLIVLPILLYRGKKLLFLTVKDYILLE